MALHLWFTFTLAYLATTLTPGPNVLLIVRNALRHGPSAMGATFIGNLLAQLLVTSAVAVGVGALLIAVPSAFLVLKLLGAGYLIYLGSRQLFSRKASPLVAREAGLQPPGSKWKMASEAFLVSASNPKTMIFLCAFLPQFLSHDRPIALQFLEMYLTIAATVVLVHTAYCYTALRLSKRAGATRWAAALKRTTGVVFIGLGIRLLNTRAV